MTPKKEKALAALLTSPTVKAAAQETGVGSRTMRLYLKDPEFLAEYKRRCSSLLEEATNKAKAALPPAIERLSSIVMDDAQPTQYQIAACRALCEYSLRMTEVVDYEQRLQALEDEMRR